MAEILRNPRECVVTVCKGTVLSLPRSILRVHPDERAPVFLALALVGGGLGAAVRHGDGKVRHAVALREEHDRGAQGGRLLGREGQRADGLDDAVLDGVDVVEVGLDVERVDVRGQVGDERVPARRTGVALRQKRGRA